MANAIKPNGKLINSESKTIFLTFEKKICPFG